MCLFAIAHSASSQNRRCSTRRVNLLHRVVKHTGWPGWWKTRPDSPSAAGHSDDLPATSTPSASKMALISWGCTSSMVNVRMPQCSSALSEPSTCTWGMACSPSSARRVSAVLDSMHFFKTNAFNILDGRRQSCCTGGIYRARLKLMGQLRKHGALSRHRSRSSRRR